MEINKEMIIVLLVVLLIIWCLVPFVEGFDASGTDFVPVSCPKYGLRGDRLRTSDIKDTFISPYRQIRLSRSNGEMWESDYPPGLQGIRGCYQVQCPTNTNGYDCRDTCWKCGSSEPAPMKIPDIHPHVPN